MNIIKVENHEPDKECLQMMETAVEELDLKLRKVINYIHNLPDFSV
jgi:hypothetical protein